MKRPAIPRGMRSEVLGQLRDMREADCTWPRRHAGRPRCGRCISCDTDGMISRGGARLH